MNENMTLKYKQLWHGLDIYICITSVYNWWVEYDIIYKKRYTFLAQVHIKPLTSLCHITNINIYHL